MKEFTYTSLRSGHEKTDRLYLYGEINGSAMLDDYQDESGTDQLHAFARYLSRNSRDELAVDAVPIFWSVRGERTVEAAPWCPSSTWLPEHFLDRFTHPREVRTGKPLDWFTLPVRQDRFPAFQKALGWKPSPLQAHCPIVSILRSRGLGGWL